MPILRQASSIEGPSSVAGLVTSSYWKDKGNSDAQISPVVTISPTNILGLQHLQPKEQSTPITAGSRSRSLHYCTWGTRLSIDLRGVEDDVGIGFLQAMNSTSETWFG